MSLDPLNTSKSTKSFVPASLEGKLKNNKCLFKVLISIITLVSLGVIALVICASLALIPWTTAAVPITIGLITMALSLMLLKRNLDTKSHLIGLFEFKKKLKTSLEEESKKIFPSLKDFSSILSSEKLKKTLFPLEGEHLDPTIWFSNQRLQEAFSQEWLRSFSTQQAIGYFYKDFNTMLTLYAGNISIFQTPSSQNKLGATVNSANANMSPEESEINAALSQAVTSESWEDSKEGKTKLYVSEVSVGKWIYKNPVDPKNLQPTYLFQALGPKASDSPDTFEAYRVLIQTYLNCFKKAASLQVTHLQLPLLSSSSFGIPERGWPNMVRLAFLAGLSLFLEQSPQSSLRNIILIDLHQPPNFC